MPAGSDTSTPPDDGSVQKFPSFEGKDLDGNEVKSDELFSANAVTVMNFWFTTCNPCVGELSDLDALNQELAEKGGALIGANTFTLDGDEAAISEVKDVLAKKGATYQNVYFDSDGEAVSYTHLDVYKRQAQFRTERAIQKLQFINIVILHCTIHSIEMLCDQIE